MCKDSLILKSNLELALSITLKNRELQESNHVVVECHYLKIRGFLSLWIKILVFKIMTSFANVVRTTASTNKFI